MARWKRKGAYKALVVKRGDYYVKAMINKKDELCPIIKCRNMRKMLKVIDRCFKVYDCDVMISTPGIRKSFEES